MGLWPNATDPVLLKYQDSIRDFGYISEPVQSYQGDGLQEIQPTIKFSDKASLVTSSVNVRALSPSTIFDDAFVLDHYDSNTGLPPTEQLYTARGSQGLATSMNNADTMVQDLADYRQTLLLKNTGFGPNDVYYRKRVLWTIKRSPDWNSGD